MQFAEIVKEARLQARLSQRGLAEQLTTAQKPEGVWATYVGQIEKGDKVPSDEVCIKLAEVLELDPDVVLLAAYQAKASSQEGRDLFAKMARSLTDPVVNQLLASEEPLAPSVLEALADADYAIPARRSAVVGGGRPGAQDTEGTRCAGFARSGGGDGRQALDGDNGYDRDDGARSARLMRRARRSFLAGPGAR